MTSFDRIANSYLKRAALMRQLTALANHIIYLSQGKEVPYLDMNSFN
jgi:hypothetical protein